MDNWKHNSLAGLSVDRQREFRHPTTEGLYFRAAPSGRKTWVFDRSLDGNRHKKTIGRFPAISIIEAQAIAARFNGRIERGEPIEEPAPVPVPVVTRMTLCVAFDSYIKDCERRGVRSIESYIMPAWRSYIEPTCGDKFVRDVTADDIRTMCAKPIENGVGSTGGLCRANAVLRVAKAIFNFCLVNDYDDLAKSPVRAVKPVKVVGSKKKRVLSIRELALAIMAARELDRRNQGKSTWADAMTLLVLTGCRKSEVLEAMGGEWDSAAKVWTIARDRYKTAVEPNLPVGPTAAAIFDRRARPGEFVIPAQSGVRTGQNTHITDKLGEIMAEIAGEPIERWTMHSTRYGFRSGIRKSKIADSELAERLIHPGRGLEMSQHYDPDFFDEMKEALAAWDALIAAEIQSVIAQRMVAVA